MNYCDIMYCWYVVMYVVVRGCVLLCAGVLYRVVWCSDVMDCMVSCCVVC